MERILKYIGIFENDYGSIYIPALESKFQHDCLEYLAEHKFERSASRDNIYAVLETDLIDRLRPCEIVSLMLDLSDQIRLDGNKNLTECKQEFLQLFEALKKNSDNK